VSVRDEGVGIPPERIGELFDMFSQLDRTLERSQGGLGIGLHLVKRLAELHGGTVTARSAGVGHGSEFVVRLPVAASADTVDARDEGGNDAARDTQLQRILIVDDNLDAARSLAMLLELGGRETALAHDGDEAVRRAAEYEPDAILLDIGMPKMNGYDAC